MFTCKDFYDYFEQIYCSKHLTRSIILRYTLLFLVKNSNTRDKSSLHVKNQISSQILKWLDNGKQDDKRSRKLRDDSKNLEKLYIF